MWLTCRPGGHALSMGVGRVGPESALAVIAIWVSPRLGERERVVVLRLADLIAPALSLFSQSVTTLGLRETPHQEIRPIPPVTAHVRTHTHKHALTQGRGNVVTTALN